MKRRDWLKTTDAGPKQASVVKETPFVTVTFQASHSPVPWCSETLGMAVKLNALDDEQL